MCDAMWCDVMWGILFHLLFCPRHRPVVDPSLVRPGCHSFQAIGLNPQYQVVIKESPWLSSSALPFLMTWLHWPWLDPEIDFPPSVDRLSLHIPNGLTSDVRRHYSHTFIHSQSNMDSFESTWKWLSNFPCSSFFFPSAVLKQNILIDLIVDCLHDKNEW